MHILSKSQFYFKIDSPGYMRVLFLDLTTSKYFGVVTSKSQALLPVLQHEFPTQLALSHLRRMCMTPVKSRLANQFISSLNH